VSGLFDAWIKDGPFAYQSNNASGKRGGVATLLLSILAGHQHYAHLNGIRQDAVHPQLLGVKQIVSEDAATKIVNSNSIYTEFFTGSLICFISILKPY
jgi:hypothetical protein